MSPAFYEIAYQVTDQFAGSPRLYGRQPVGWRLRKYAGRLLLAIGGGLCNILTGMHG